MYLFTVGVILAKTSEIEIDSENALIADFVLANESDIAGYQFDLLSNDPESPIIINF